MIIIVISAASCMCRADRWPLTFSHLVQTILIQSPLFVVVERLAEPIWCRISVSSWERADVPEEAAGLTSALNRLGRPSSSNPNLCSVFNKRRCGKLLLRPGPPHETAQDPHDAQPSPQLRPVQKHGNICEFSHF